MNGADLGFRDAIRAAEVEPRGRPFRVGLVQVLEYGVDLLLRELTAQWRAPIIQSAATRNDFTLLVLRFLSMPPTENACRSDE